MGGLSLRAGVFVLACVCVVAAQAVSFSLLLAFPARPPAAMTAREAVLAIAAAKDATANGLTRSLVAAPAFVSDTDGYSPLVSRLLEALLVGTPRHDLRVHALARSVSVKVATDMPPMTASRAAIGGLPPASAMQLADAPFPSFEVGVRQVDGRWIVVGPKRPWITPEALRLIAAFALSVLLVAPLTWWSARRLTRPLLSLATASQTLGRNPGAPPLVIDGPSEVRTAAAAFNEMQTRLANHMRERVALMAAIAHDLRTPLTGLRLRIETAPPAERDRMVADVVRMELLIADLLVFVQGEQPDARREPIDLRALVEDCVTEAIARGADVALGNRFGATVLGEPLALRRILENLLVNAAAYAGSATVAIDRSNGRVWVSVADDGPGIPSDALERIFDPFVRLESSRSRATGGAGLGLAIARKLARAHGGELHLCNREPHGLEARLVLPEQI